MKHLTNEESWRSGPNEATSNTSSDIEVTFNLTIDVYAGEFEILDENWATDIKDDEYDIEIISASDLEDFVFNLIGEALPNDCADGEHSVTIELSLDYEIYGVNYFADGDFDASDATADFSITCTGITIQ